VKRAPTALAGVALAAALGVAAPAAAHVKAPKRAVILQVDDQGLAVLWRAEVSGRDAMLLHSLHDRDRDGALRGMEGKRAAAVILAKAMSGTKIRWEGRAVPYNVEQVELEGEPESGQTLAAVALLSIEVPAFHGAVTVEVQKGGELQVDAQCKAPWTVTAVDRGTVAPGRDSLVAPVMLRAGTSLRMTVERGHDG